MIMVMIKIHSQRGFRVLLSIYFSIVFLTKTCLFHHTRYDEVCKPGYSFSNGGFSSGTGHFTQVVWKDSIKLGIGQGKATQNGMPCIYVVGRYEIAGNMMGEFQDQVLRGNFNEAYCNNVKK